MRRVTHLSDDRLVNLCLDGGATRGELTHLDVCDACNTRHTGLERLLREVADAATIDADAAFPPERLAVQQARILQRVAQDGRPGRVIAFPSATTSGVRMLRARPAARWVAVAAAAGLAIGLVVGRLTHAVPPSLALRTPAARGVAARFEPVTGFNQASMVLSENQLLGEIEVAVAGPVAVLRPLNELTPVVDTIWPAGR